MPLCTLRIQLKPPIVVGAGPAGTRLIVEVASAQVKGDRLRGEMLGAAAADWVIVGPEGTGTVDVRVTLQTDDGAVIFVQYNGRLDASRGQQFPTPRLASRRATSVMRGSTAFRRSARESSTRIFRSTTSGTRSVSRAT